MLKKLLLSALVALATLAPALAASTRVSGSASSAATIVTNNVAGYDSVGVQFTSVGSGNTVTFYESTDGTNWVVKVLYPQSNTSTVPGSAYAVSTSETYAGNLTQQYFKADVTTYGSGTVSVFVTYRTNGPGGFVSNNFTSVPSSASGAAIVTVKSTALESNHVICAAACNLYGWSVTTGAVQGWVLLYNGTTAPTAGGAAVAPQKCFYAPANSSLAGGNSGPPQRFVTGMVIVFSSTGCLTNTASATVFISGDAS